MKTRFFRAALLSSLAFAGATVLPDTATATATATTTQTVTPRAITTPLVPSKVYAGDREFNGNGPDIKAEARLSISPDGKSLMARIDFKARETQHDWSETRKRWDIKIWDAPSSKKIVSITSPKYSKVEFTSEPAGFQIIAPSDDMQKFASVCVDIAKEVVRLYVQLEGESDETTQAEEIIDTLGRLAREMEVRGNKIYMKAPSTPGPVAVFAIVGDTGGPDISTDDSPKDDTRIERIEFAPVDLVLANR